MSIGIYDYKYTQNSAILLEQIAALQFLEQQNKLQQNTTSNAHTAKSYVKNISMPAVSENSNGGNLINAASQAYPTVVHITTSSKHINSKDNSKFDYKMPYSKEERYGSSGTPASSGSGVIISSDGYIITNNHVISSGGNILVALHDKETYKAKVIGIDASTDLALLKVDAQGLPAISYGDSDALQVGEWVLAVGNPFNLTSTVTAGIVSAKGRNINILDADNAIEAFIQTDAAVNEGNSGGALVNLNGELVGINTAIATTSGTYAGYSFAVPVNMIKKVVEDLQSYGLVQRAYLGVNTQDITDEIKHRLGLRNMDGVYVELVIEGSSAQVGGLKKDDIITEINGYKVNSVPELKEKIARFSPGDAIGITFVRKGEKQFIQVILKNVNQEDVLISPDEADIITMLGADFEELSVSQLKRMGLLFGIQITSLTSGILQDNTAIRPGFILLKVDNNVITTLDNFYSHLKKIRKGDGVIFEGIYVGEKRRTLYAFSMK